MKINVSIIHIIINIKNIIKINNTNFRGSSKLENSLHELNINNINK